MTTGLGLMKAAGMYTRCLFCRSTFPENGELAHMPRGRRIAFDPEEGRLWAVCHSCSRWNLCPIESREAALHELERLARDHGRLVAETANIALLQVGHLMLIRVGRERGREVTSSPQTTVASSSCTSGLTASSSVAGLWYSNDPGIMLAPPPTPVCNNLVKR